MGPEEDIEDMLYLEGLFEGTPEYDLRKIELKVDRCVQMNRVAVCTECAAFYTPCTLIERLRDAGRNKNDR